MQTLLAKKQTEEQKQLNETTRYQFLLAVLNMDEKMLRPLLKKDNIFFGHMNYWQVLHWFRKQFELLPKGGYYSQYKEYLSLDFYPGTINFEFSYGPMEALFTDPSNPLEVINLEQVFESKNVSKLKLSLQFENGLITDIRIPKIEAEMKLLPRFIREN